MYQISFRPSKISFDVIFIDHSGHYSSVLHPPPPDLKVECRCSLYAMLEEGDEDFAWGKKAFIKKIPARDSKVLGKGFPTALNLSRSIEKSMSLARAAERELTCSREKGISRRSLCEKLRGVG